MPRKPLGSPQKVDHHGQPPLDAQEKSYAIKEGKWTSSPKVDVWAREENHLRGSLMSNGSELSDEVEQEAPRGSLLPPERGDKEKMAKPRQGRRWRPASPWACSLPMLITTALATTLILIIVHAFLTRQLDPKGCDMCWSRPIYVKFRDFDTEHTRFASKYGLYMIKEGGMDEDPQVKGVPILFIPGNAGSYKQARCLQFESAHYYQSVIQQDVNALKNGATSLDFFTVDTNEDFSAFHGQTLLDQAEYVNDAVAYILSLYHDPRRTQRDPTLPDPSSVILIGHSMGGLVARAMLAMPNYQSNSINTIITMSTPHARAPVSVDADLVRTYEKVNDYWRRAHLQEWANDNPLWHVTLISIAGGGLDTVVPSDYASLESLIPLTHGFTVFTSGIPYVWTGADHIQTTWCVQLMKAIMRSIFETLDVHRSSQTKPRSERMRIFKRWYLTGMEDAIEKSLPQQEASTLVPLEKDTNTMLRSDERLVLRDLGHDQKRKAYLLPVPPQIPPEQKKFTFLSDQSLRPEVALIDVLLCSMFSPQAGQSASLLSMNLDLSGETPGSTRLACKSASLDSIKLPASIRLSSYPFGKAEPFTYLEYGPSELADHQFVAIIDKATEPHKGWAIAEFSEITKSKTTVPIGIRRLLAFGVHLKLPAKRSMVTEVHIPAFHSSLLAFHLEVGPQACGDEAELFTPLLRQYIEEPFESKFVVNTKSANVSLHGIAPFMPPPLRSQSAEKGVSLQFWTDPTCNSSIDVSLKVDLAGSMGKLVMRYRLVFAAFPVLVVATVLRKQFSFYDETGIFMPFSEAANLCLKSSLPVLILGLSLVAASSSLSKNTTQVTGFFGPSANATESAIDFTKNDTLLGSPDPIFWFLLPMFGLISVGICILVNYATLGVTYLFYSTYDFIKARPSWARVEDISGRSIAPGFSPTSLRRRLITTCILLFLVATLIPYQFAFMDAVLVQLMTSVRALRLAKSSDTASHHNFYNYTHSILLLMIWILPVNLPVLVVWVHNLAVHWFTPFSSHHNIISIMPYLILVETLTSGKMIPRLTGRGWGRGRYVTNTLFFALAVFAAVYGVSYAYMLHQFVNGVCAWLVAVHIWGNGGVDLRSVREILEGGDEAGGEHMKKQP